MITDYFKVFTALLYDFDCREDVETAEVSEDKQPKVHCAAPWKMFPHDDIFDKEPKIVVASQEDEKKTTASLPGIASQVLLQESHKKKFISAQNKLEIGMEGHGAGKQKKKWTHGFATYSLPAPIAWPDSMQAEKTTKAYARLLEEGFQFSTR